MRTLLLAALVVAMTACVQMPARTLATPAPCPSWGRLPLTVALDPSAQAYRFDLRHAEYSWTRALGRTVFAIEALERADIVVATGPVPNDIANAVMTSSSCKSGRVRTTVYLAPDLDDFAATAFLEHGLGHALGLAHSTNEQSVMQHQLDVALLGVWDEDHPPRMYRVTELDAELVRALHPDIWRPVTPAYAGFDWLSIINMASPLITWLVGQLIKSTVKDSNRQREIASYADTAFHVVEALSVSQGWSGVQKYNRFIEQIVDALKAAGQPELSASEMQQLQQMAQVKAMLAKPVPRLPLPPPLPRAA